MSVQVKDWLWMAVSYSIYAGWLNIQSKDDVPRSMPSCNAQNATFAVSRRGGPQSGLRTCRGYTLVDPVGTADARR